MKGTIAAAVGADEQLWRVRRCQTPLPCEKFLTVCGSCQLAYRSHKN